MQTTTAKAALIFGAPMGYLALGTTPPYVRALLIAGIALALWIAVSGLVGAAGFAGRSLVLAFAGFSLAFPSLVIVAWVAAIVPVIFLRRDCAPTGALLLMLSGVVLFAVGSPFPSGLVGLSSFGAGLAWLYMDACERAEINAATPRANVA